MRSIRVLAKQPFFLFHIVAAMFAWFFVWHHAFIMDIVYDEASSYYILKIGNYKALPGVANTHWLNSFFMRLLMTFNESVICLRLHVIFAFLFFAHGIYRLATLIKSTGAQITFYCLIVFNPYILDFFSLARGYSLAITLQVWTILAFIKAVQTDFNYRQWIKLIILSALTLGANLSYQYTIMAITGGYLLYCSITDSLTSWYTNVQKRRITIFFVLLLFFSTADLLFIKYYGKDLEFGGRENFIGSVFNTFWNKSLYKASYTPLSVWLSWCTFALIVIAGIYFIRKTIQQKKWSPGIIITFITGTIFLLGIIFHLVFNTPFIANRTALQWYVPGLLTIFLAAGEWQVTVKKYHFIGYALGTATCLLVVFHFVTRYNSRRCMEYYMEDPTRQPLYDLYAQHPTHPGLSFWIAGTYIGYYSQVDQLVPPGVIFEEFTNEPLTDKAIQTLRESDYILSHTITTTRFLDGAGIRYTIIKSYPDNDFKVIRLHH